MADPLPAPSGAAIIVIEWVFVALSASAVLLRLWSLRFPQNLHIVSTYLVTIGFICFIGQVVTDTWAFRLGGLDAENAEDLPVSTALLKLGFSGLLLFYGGVYFVKGSILAFYYALIPEVMTKTRIALHLGAGLATCSFLMSIFLYSFWCTPFDQNWSLEPGACSATWSTTVFITCWAADVATDVYLFVLPFSFALKLKVRRREKFAIVSIFLVGAITIAISVGRFVSLATSPVITSVYIWTAAEFCGAIVVASSPSLKFLVGRTTKSTKKSSMKTSNTENTINTLSVDLV